ncbi:tetratricopeptide repeat protein [Rhodoferax sp. OV413]|uniref:tetratricopeptide repeat protein n=1 Tax=Rhodoferax sp. OV413 TaxID=1855285 RepID=UPI0025E948E4|nr:tetratricopeptide repeat protein [Rhodoferax sp. OV413]
MKIIFIAVQCIVALNAFAADVSAPAPPTLNELMSSARQAIERKGWSRAQYDLKIAVRDEPNNADAHNLLAYTYRKQAQPDLIKAFEHYKIALKLDPQHRGAHEYIGEAYLMDGKPEQAERHLAALEKVCGNRQCEEYLDLAQALANYRKTTPR